MAEQTVQPTAKDLMDKVNERIDATFGRYGEIDTKTLEELSDMLTVRAKDAKNNTILSQFLLGKSISAKAYEHIKGDVPEAIVESMKFRKPIKFDDAGNPTAWTEGYKYRNKVAVAVNTLHEAGKLTSQEGSQLVDHNLRQKAVITSENVVVGMAGSERRAVQTVLIQRKREGMKVKAASLLEIYQAVVERTQPKTPETPAAAPVAAPVVQ